MAQECSLRKSSCSPHSRGCGRRWWPQCPRPWRSRGCCRRLQGDRPEGGQGQPANVKHCPQPSLCCSGVVHLGRRCRAKAARAALQSTPPVLESGLKLSKAQAFGSPKETMWSQPCCFSSARPSSTCWEENKSARHENAMQCIQCTRAHRLICTGLDGRQQQQPSGPQCTHTHRCSFHCRKCSRSHSRSCRWGWAPHTHRCSCSRKVILPFSSHSRSCRWGWAPRRQTPPPPRPTASAHRSQRSQHPTWPCTAEGEQR